MFALGINVSAWVIRSQINNFKYISSHLALKCISMCFKQTPRTGGRSPMVQQKLTSVICSFVLHFYLTNTSKVQRNWFSVIATDQLHCIQKDMNKSGIWCRQNYERNWSKGLFTLVLRGLSISLHVLTVWDLRKLISWRGAGFGTPFGWGLYI